MMNDPRKDPTRPRYIRPAGEFGICLDVYDAEASNPNDYGSIQFFNMNLMDSLYETFAQLSLEGLRDIFEEKGLLDGVIFEKFYKGIILSVSFDDIMALDELWKVYKDGSLGKIIAQTLITPELLRGARVKAINLRTRLWQDEYDSVKEEIEAGAIKPMKVTDKELYKNMIAKVKEYQTQLPQDVSNLRDQRNKVDSNFSELIMLIKRFLPEETKMIGSINEFQEYTNAIYKLHPSNMSVLTDFFKFLELSKETLMKMKRFLIQPLKQISSRCETPSQRKLKVTMSAICRKSLNRLEESYDLTNLRHTEWKKKFTAKEEFLFLGLFSLVSFSQDAVCDLDQYVDEYLSGFIYKL